MYCIVYCREVAFSELRKKLMIVICIARVFCDGGGGGCFASSHSGNILALC